jgi:hypothetical protein
MMVLKVSWCGIITFSRRFARPSSAGGSIAPPIVALIELPSPARGSSGPETAGARRRAGSAPSDERARRRARFRVPTPSSYPAKTSR